MFIFSGLHRQLKKGKELLSVMFRVIVSDAMPWPSLEGQHMRRHMGRAKRNMPDQPV